MPITIYPSNNTVSTVEINPDYNPSWSAAFLTKNPFEIAREWFQTNGEVFQSSFPLPSKNNSDDDFIIQARNYNGFVDTAISAYNQHHHLVIRPDDIWLTILSQFNLVVNANAEQFRHLFVSHKGQKELEITVPGTRYSADFGDLAIQMGELIQENVIDPSLREWVMPEFTTTTENDVIISSVIMMSTLKKYFSYRFSFLCGLPAVTLLGEREDWAKILDKVDKLKEYGVQTTQWGSLLKVVLAGFVDTFSHPEAENTKDFWQKIAHYENEGSGSSYISGWITAFCFFDNDGEHLYYLPSDNNGGGLTLEGVAFHRVSTDDIPSAFAEVPVLLDDNGVKIKTVMMAGLLGTRISGVDKGTVQAQPAWWIAEELGKGNNEGRGEWEG